MGASSALAKQHHYQLPGRARKVRELSCCGGIEGLLIPPNYQTNGSLTRILKCECVSWHTLVESIAFPFTH